MFTTQKLSFEKTHYNDNLSFRGLLNMKYTMF